MNDILLKVSANRLEILQDTYTTGGSVNYDGCLFSFDNTWKNFHKTAVFGFGESDYIRIELESDSCKIPSICLQNEGIIKIGVYGVNDDGVVITTNAVAHRVDEGIGEENNWYEEDNLFVYNAMKELEGALDKYKGELEQKFQSLLTMLRKTGSLSDSYVFPGEPDEWYFPTQIDKNPKITPAEGQTKCEAYLDYKLNGLLRDFPEYVNRKQIGTDASGVYPIYSYIFEPLNYEKTIFIADSLQYKNDYSTLALSLFLDDLCRNYSDNRTLLYIRSKIKLVVVPIANPYGLEKNTLYNSNGVDLQKNFPYMWNECTSDKKGSRPVDQAEIGAMFNILGEIYEDKLCAGLDLCANTNEYCGKTLFYPRFKDNCINEIAHTLYRYNYDKPEDEEINKTILAATINTSLVNFLAEQFSINACCIRWSYSKYIGEYTCGYVTKFAELIGNMLYTLAKNSSYTVRRKELPFTNHFSWRSKGDSDVFVVSNSSTGVKVPISSLELEMKKPCNITLSGYVVVKVKSGCTLSINPVLWQENSPEQSFEDRASMTDFAVTLPLSAGTYSVPIETVIQAYVSDTTVKRTSCYPKTVRFTLLVNSTVASAAEIVGYSFMLNAFETNAGKPVELYRPMGYATDYTDENDIPTQELIYPKGIITQKDAEYDI